MAPPAARTTRIKKLSKSAGQQILREDQIEDYDSLSLHTESKADSGVEKGEEKVSNVTCTLYHVLYSSASGIPSTSRISKFHQWPK